MSSISIIKPGLFTTIQDRGRYGYRKYGIPVSGAMDKYAAGLANALVNKPSDAALIEIILSGPEIRFNEDTCVAITGADLSPAIAGQAVKMNTTLMVQAGKVLSFGKSKYGAIAYVATCNEIISETILGSKSFYEGITDINRFYAGKTIFLEEAQQGFSIPSSSIKVQKEHFISSRIIAWKGPEFDLLNQEKRQLLLENSFNISREYNRMGYKLEGPPLLLHEAASMISSAVLPGTVQLIPNGQLIVLMNDCQTTGGYPRILQLPQNSINQLAQKKPGDGINWQLGDG